MITPPIQIISHAALQFATLPQTIRLCVSLPETGEAQAKAESHGAEDGHVLQMLAELLPGQDHSTLELIRVENERPRLYINRVEFPISISHTRGIAGLAVSASDLTPHAAIGIDIERIDRVVAPALWNRMRHPMEEEHAMGETPIRIWTLKEAALKWLGTGLRTPMNSVKLEKIAVRPRSHTEDSASPAGEPEILLPARFSATFSDGIQVEICSFAFKTYWISVAYDTTRQ